MGEGEECEEIEEIGSVAGVEVQGRRKGRSTRKGRQIVGVAVIVALVLFELQTSVGTVRQQLHRQRTRRSVIRQLSNSPTPGHCTTLTLHPTNYERDREESYSVVLSKSVTFLQRGWVCVAGPM